MDKQMVYNKNAHEMILDRLEQQKISLFNIPHTCITSGTTNVKEVIRDSLSGQIVHSENEYYSNLYYINLTEKPGEKRIHLVQHTYALLKGLDVAQWVMERLPQQYGTFAIMLRPKEASMDTAQRKVWVFMAI